MANPTFELIKELVPDYFYRSYGIIFRLKGYLKSIDFESKDELLKSIFFISIISIIGSLIIVPVYINLKINYSNGFFFALDTITTVFTYCGYAFIYHIIAKLLGGKGKFQETLIVVLSSFAYAPLWWLTGVPFVRIYYKFLMTEDLINTQFYDKINSCIQPLSEHPVYYIIMIIQSILLILYARTLYIGIQHIHNLKKISTFLVVFEGIIIWIMGEYYLNPYVTQYICKGFKF